MSVDLTSDRTLLRLLDTWATARAREDVIVHLPDVASAESIRRVSWQRLAEDVARLRSRLAGIGVKDQERVVMALPNAPLTVALWVAIPANGAVLHVLEPDTGRLPLERTLATLSPVAIIVPTELAPLAEELVRAAGHSTRVIAIAESALAGTDVELGPLGASPPTATADLVSHLLPTSGTSGAPKMVQLTHRNYVLAAERLSRNSGFTTADRHYLCSPFSHTNAQLYLAAPPFVTGGSMAILPRFSASRYFDAARWTGATVASMVAPPLRMALHKAIAAGGKVDIGALRLIQYGMQLSAADWEGWDRLFPTIAMRQIYGQTESVTGVLGGAPWEADDRRTIGRPFLGVDAVRLVSDGGEGDADVADGQPGELWVRGVPGSTLMLGYRQAPEATARTLRTSPDGTWLRTGDIMIRHDGGRFEFVGRSMHLIRRGGENLSTYALELDLQRCPFVSDVAITAKEDPVLDAVVIAHVIPSATYDEAAFLGWCRENLGKRGIPDHVKVHQEFPRTPSGRVLVREL